MFWEQVILKEQPCILQVASVYVSVRGSQIYSHHNLYRSLNLWMNNLLFLLSPYWLVRKLSSGKLFNLYFGPFFFKKKKSFKIMLFHLFQVFSIWPPHQHRWACLRYRARWGQWLLKPSCEEKRRLPRQSPLFLSNLGQWWVAVLLPSLGLAGVWFWSKGPNLGSSVHRHTQSLGPTSILSPNWVFDSLP